jgi:alkylhydroperoxidase/carboxymuconolactone decarboxylase family protein YurZ
VVDEADVEAFRPDSSVRLQQLLERLDPSFAAVWSTHPSRLLGRIELDVRTRLLMRTAQYTVTQQDERLEENLGAARSAGVEAVDLLEAALQMYVHTGPWVVAAACETYKRVLEQCEETAGDVASEIASRSTPSIRTRPRHREHVVVRC